MKKKKKGMSSEKNITCISHFKEIKKYFQIYFGFLRGLITQLF